MRSAFFWRSSRPVPCRITLADATVLGALMLNIIAMVLFVTAGSGAALIAARAVQGFATGVATAALGAAILDVDQRRGAVLNSITVFAGLTVGTLGAATLVTFAPDPAQLVYVVLLTLSGIEALLIWHMPETVQTKPGALTSLRPHVSIPIQARQTLVQLTPVTFASWALGGFYFSLMPALVRVATGATLPIVGGLVVAALTFSSVIAILSLLSIPADRVLLGGIPALALGVAITLGGVHAQFRRRHAARHNGFRFGIRRRVLWHAPSRPAARQG